MKIYTKKGDNGKTQLLGGSIVDKNNIKLECYGSIDELNAFIGNIYDQQISKKHKIVLFKIQNHLFNIGSSIAFDKVKQTLTPPNITDKDVKMLEKTIDTLENDLPALKNFILPSGHDLASKCHIARTVCRRAERNLVSLHKTENIDLLHMQYLNRLSDFLFVLSRTFIIEKNALEIEWQKKQ